MWTVAAPAPFGLSAGGGASVRLCLASQNSVLVLLLFINQVHGVCAYRASKHMSSQYLAVGPPPFIAHTITFLLTQQLVFHEDWYHQT